MNEYAVHARSSRNMKDTSIQYNSEDQFGSDYVCNQDLINPYTPWEHRRVVVSPSCEDVYPVYEDVKPKTLFEAAKDLLSNIFEVVPEDSGTKPHNNVFRGVRPVEYHAAPLHPEYRQVVYVVAPRVDNALPERSRVVKVERNLPQVVKTLESDIVCRGHDFDRRQLCFGCTVPPRQYKFEIVKQNVNNCFGICTGSRYKAVCKKCKAPFPTCTFCGKQSVIEHP